MNSKKMDIGSKDLISSLPDALLCHILSNLSTTDSALTSVLSKRWRDLLAFVPNLDLDFCIYDQRPQTSRRKSQQMLRSFKVFVNRVMALQGNAPLNKFSLKCQIGRDASFVNGWILKVLERGVVDLDLNIRVPWVYNYTLPPKVFMSNTLVRLKLEGTSKFTINVEEVFLPKLKTLSLVSVPFGDESGAAFAKLISGCHVLEELVMIDVRWGLWESRSVSNRTLKRLKIYSDYIAVNPKSVSFYTPNLVHLKITDTVAVKYPKASFDSLVEASFDLRMTPDELDYARETVEAAGYGYSLNMMGDAADFLMGISNVKILYLSCETLEVLAFSCKAIPVFNNLTHLTIESSREVEWDSLPNLLENCPNLETLVFEGLHYRDTNQCLDESYRFKETNKCDEYLERCECKPWAGTPIWLSSSPVKMLKVLNFGETFDDKDDMDKQMDLIKYFLETMPNLEQVILYYDTSNDGDLNKVSTDLQVLEKVASPKCNIEILSDKISFSSTVGSSSSASGLVFFKNYFPLRKG